MKYGTIQPYFNDNDNYNMDLKGDCQNKSHVYNNQERYRFGDDRLYMSLKFFYMPLRKIGSNNTGPPL